VLNDPEITRLLREHFVPIAIDNAQNPQWTPEEKAWLQTRGGRSSTYALTLMSAGGQVFQQAQSYQAPHVKKMIEKTLAAFKPEAGVVIDAPGVGPPDKAIMILPPDGLAMNVGWKVLEFGNLLSLPVTGSGKYDHCFAATVGADRLWVLPNEADELVQGKFPDSLKRRISRFHLDFVFPGKMKEVSLDLRDGLITGSALSDLGETIALRGHVEVKDGKVQRFDLLAKGLATHRNDAGFAGPLTVVPKDTHVPVALLLELTDPATPLGRVPPHHGNAWSYWR
jgi:hypothetical protein